jgi:gamma-glutamyltranspeptidase/glutathione hydrolase
MYPQAAEAGAAMLAQGGSAVDAAVAAAFAVGVVEPFNSGLGGIGQVVYYEARTGRTYVVDGIPTLPAGVSPERFPLMEGGGPTGVYGWPAVQDDANNTGYLASAVPGLPGCLCEALRRFGRLSRAAVMAPAIHLAEHGFELDWYVALALAGAQRRLWQFPESRRVFFRPDGSCYRATMIGMNADQFAQPDLARSLRLIAQEGPDALYRGTLARRIAADMSAHGGTVTERDLAAFQPRLWEPGLQSEYRGYQLVQAPEHTGAPTAVETLNILAGFDLGRLGHNRPETLHLLAEALRRAFVDRLHFLGDAARQPVPHDALVSRAYADQRRATISPDRATPDAAPGDPWPLSAVPRPPAPGMAPGTGAREGHTTHLTVIDQDHNMVALTATLGGHFGSGVTIAGTGIVLNNATMWFDPRPGRTNSIAPGKRLLWAGTPTLVLRDGRPFLALGAPGGRRIISAVVQVLTNVIDFGLGIQEAVAAPRLHCEGVETEVDHLVGAAALGALREAGHQVVPREEHFGTSYFARPNGVLVRPEDGTLRGGVNQYKPAMAIGL